MYLLEAEVTLCPSLPVKIETETERLKNTQIDIHTITEIYPNITSYKGIFMNTICTGCFQLGVFFEMAISQPIFNIFSIGKKVRYLEIETFLKLLKLSKSIKN